MDDKAREVKIFLASSNELIEERKEFSNILNELNSQPNISRNFKLVPVRWEKDAFGGGKEDINTTIRNTVEFDTIDIVIIVVWNKLGQGTFDEFNEAYNLLILYDKPVILVFIREPSHKNNSFELEKIEAFKKSVIDKNIVSNLYNDFHEFREKIKIQISSKLPTTRKIDISPIWKFKLVAPITFLLSIYTIYVSRTMGFPDNEVSSFNVLSIIAAPPVLFFLSVIVFWYLTRTLSSLKAIWFSPHHSNKKIYDLFHNIIPHAIMPKQIKKEFPSNALSDSITFLVLIFLFFTPIAAQYNCLFAEILVWEYTITNEWGSKGNNSQLVNSKYVDRNRKIWPFTLQDKRVKEKYDEEEGDSVIYVHAEGKFRKDETLSPDQFFRKNLGPEVFLPAQPIIYLIMMIISIILSIIIFARIFTFRREWDLYMLRRQKGE